MVTGTWQQRECRRVSMTETLVPHHSHHQREKKVRRRRRKSCKHRRPRRPIVRSNIRPIGSTQRRRHTRHLPHFSPPERRDGPREIVTSLALLRVKILKCIPRRPSRGWIIGWAIRRENRDCPHRNGRRKLPRSLQCHPCPLRYIPQTSKGKVSHHHRRRRRREPRRRNHAITQARTSSIDGSTTFSRRTYRAHSAFRHLTTSHRTPDRTRLPRRRPKRHGARRNSPEGMSIRRPPRKRTRSQRGGVE